MKRLLFIFIFVLSITALIRNSDKVYAETVIASGTCGENAAWALTGSDTEMTLNITGYGEMIDYTESSCPWATKRGKIQQVIIEDGITKIGDYSFYSLNRLTSITLPNTIEDIGAHSFESCINLEQLELPDDLVCIGYSAFKSCTSIEELTIPETVDSIGSAAFASCTSMTDLSILGIVSLKMGTFNGCNNIKTIKTRSQLSYLKDGWSGGQGAEYSYEPVFDSGNSITSVEILDGIGTKIWPMSFYQMSHLESLTIPSGITSFGVRAFAGCSSLTEVHVPDIKTWVSIEKTGNMSGARDYPFCESNEGHLFVRDTEVKNVVIPEGVKTLYRCAFYGCSEIASVQFPQSLTSVYNTAFDGCSKLTRAYITDIEQWLSVKPIPFISSAGGSIYCDGTRVQNLEIPEGIDSIGDSAFYNCKDIKSLSLPEGITSIGTNAFARCIELTSLTIPRSCTSIKNTAFSECTKLRELVASNDVLKSFYSDSVTTVRYLDGEDTISSFSSNLTNVDTIVLPDSIRNVWAYAFQNASNLSTVCFDNEIQFFSIRYWCEDSSSAVYNKNRFPFFRSSHNGDVYIDGKRIEKLVLPDDMSCIEEGRYAYWSGLQEVVLPDGLTKIEEYAFVGCSGLQNIDIGESLVVLGNHAFDGCSSLESVVIPDGVPNIGTALFANCEKLQEVVIPDSVTQIGLNSFNSCNSLHAVSIPDSVGSIKEAAFDSCSSLNTVYYSGTEAQWNSITIEANNACLTNANIICNSMNRYIIGYVLTGGTNNTDNPYSYDKSQTITLLPPTKSGYDFLGWYSDPYYETQVSGIEQDSIGNKTFYAKWCLSEYSITYEMNGGSNSPDNPSTYNTTEEIVLKNPSRKGGVFQGWYSDPQFKTKVTGIALGESGEKVFYAKWKLTYYSIVYELYEGENSSQNPSRYNTEQEIVFQDPIRTGYDFIGWYSDANYENKVTSIERGSTGSKRVYARWILHYSINYELDGGTNASANPLTYNEIQSFSFVAPSKVGFEFLGWYYDLGYENQVTGIEQGSKGDITLHARWNPIEYSITYETNGGINSSDNPLKYNATEEVVLASPTKTGYNFKGWYLDSSFTTNIVTKIYKGSTGDKVLYAKWTPKNYTISYVLNGGKLDSGWYVYNIETARELTIPTRKGYSFGGWYSDVDFTNRVIRIEKGETGNKTLYAKWEAIPYDITYSLNGGTFDDDVPRFYTIEDTLVLEEPTLNGYLFDGWYSDAGFANKVDKINKGETGDKTFFAKWRLHEYTITYEMNGGIDGGQNPSTYDITQTVNLKAPSYRYDITYDFLGWYKDKNCTEQITCIPKGSTGDTILYAKWDKNHGVCGESLQWELDGTVLRIYGIGEMFSNPNSYSPSIPPIWQGNHISHIIIEQGVTSVGSYAFANCVRLNSIIVPDSVTHIGDGAFYCCNSLASISIPNNVASIGEYALALCNNLEEISIPTGVQIIKRGTFQGCDVLTDFVIPDSVTSIDEYAFYGCYNLTSITIPESVTNISTNAFGGCCNLRNVVYSGTKEQWNSLNVVFVTSPVIDTSDPVQASVRPQKKEQLLVVKGRTVKVKYSKLKKKKKILSRAKALTVRNAKGKVTYVKISGNKGIAINKTNGIITVKKRLKKGKYKVKIRVYASGDRQYMSGTKVVTIFIRVK